MKLSMLILVILYIVSCSRNLNKTICSYNYRISIGQNLRIDQNEIESAISRVIKKNSNASDLIEIIIYGYSSGKETFFYSESISSGVIRDRYAGRIEALIKIKNNHETIKVIFLYANGNTKEQIIKNLSHKVKMTLCN